MIKEKDLFEEEKPVQSIDNRLELLNLSAQVHSPLKDKITVDFTLAKLEEKDKTGITEMVNNAFYVKVIMEKAKYTLIDEWDSETESWYRRHLNKAELKAIDKRINNTFNAFMNRIFMTAILNRNIPKNDMLQMMAGINSQFDEEQLRENATLKERVMHLGKGEKGE